MHYYFVKQQDEEDCAAACLSTIARFYGKKSSITRIRNYAGTDKKGTSAKGILKAADSLGFSCKAILLKDKKLNHDLHFPLIAHIKRDGVEHYVVIYKIKNERLLIADPAINLSWIKLNTFFEWWTGVIFILSPNIHFEKTNDNKSFFQRFWYLVSQNKLLTAETFISSFVLTILGILSAFYFRFLIDEVIYSYLPTALTSISIAYLIVIIFQSILGFARNHLIIFLGNKMEASLSLEYFKHVLNLPLDFFTKRKSGEILSRFSDINTIKN